MLLAGRASEKFPVVVTSYEIVIADSKVLQRYHWTYIVVDEGHRLKNFNCKLLRELRQIPVNNKLLLSGMRFLLNASQFVKCACILSICSLSANQLCASILEAAALSFTSPHCCCQHVTSHHIELLIRRFRNFNDVPEMTFELGLVLMSSPSFVCSGKLLVAC